MIEQTQKKPLKLFIATPAFGNSLTTTFVNSLIKFMSTSPDIDLPYQTIFHTQSGLALVTQARNNCVSEFMKSGADYLLFIDADIGFEPENIKKILRRCNETKGVVLAPYPVKNYSGVNRSINFIIHFIDQNNIEVDKEGFIKCKAGPTGFMMIHRSVFEKLMKTFPEKKTFISQVMGVSLENKNDFWYTFFETNVDPVNGYLGEDIAFCNLCNKIGIEIQADTKAHLIHYGGHAFHGSLEMTFKNNQLKHTINYVEELSKNKKK